ncbi:hypothetical protein Fmac_013943 [Flemingia macrophylla]|uniref:Uncharacterized protein n=1 Tax=Flemingia macrophylla TaxID=520843 RepID=A0ABD1MAE9_9FABA
MANGVVNGSGPAVGEEGGGGEAHNEGGDRGGVAFEGGDEGASDSAEDRDGGAATNKEAFTVLDMLATFISSTALLPDSWRLCTRTNSTPFQAFIADENRRLELAHAFHLRVPLQSRFLTASVLQQSPPLQLPHLRWNRRCVP